MDILRYFSLFLCLCFFLSCDKYYNSEESFDRIYLREWNTSSSLKKIVLEKYVKNSNFKNLKEKNSDFEVFNDTVIKFLSLTPKFRNKGEIDFDFKLIINDSIEYEISNIQNSSDTVKKTFTMGRRYYISNHIKSMMVNGHKLENNSSDLYISAKIGKIIKK